MSTHQCALRLAVFTRAMPLYRKALELVRTSLVDLGVVNADLRAYVLSPLEGARTSFRRAGRRP